MVVAMELTSGSERRSRGHGERLKGERRIAAPLAAALDLSPSGERRMTAPLVPPALLVVIGNESFDQYESVLVI